MKIIKEILILSIFFMVVGFGSAFILKHYADKAIKFNRKVMFETNIEQNYNSAMSGRLVAGNIKAISNYKLWQKIKGERDE